MWMVGSWGTLQDWGLVVLGETQLVTFCLAFMAIWDMLLFCMGWKFVGIKVEYFKC